ncbi:MAG: hypothetical protein NTU41_03565, partial [Chloroflexi bacterium]|nr:hypothetical protein [Chloroflexota bacterium]
PDCAHSLMMMFRTFSLRYRSTDYFAGLLRELRRRRIFTRYWREVYLQERDHIMTNGADLCLHSPEWGHLALFAPTATAVTAAGELHIMFFVPASAQTEDALRQVMKHYLPGDAFKLDTGWPGKVLK